MPQELGKLLTLCVSFSETPYEKKKMAAFAIMPRHCRMMRASGSIQSDQLEKESYVLLKEGEHLYQNSTFSEDSPCVSDSSSRRELPTFLARQEVNTLLAEQQQEGKLGGSVELFRSVEKKSELGAFCEGKAYTQSVLEAMKPASGFHMQRVGSMREPLQAKTSKQTTEPDNNQQKTHYGGGKKGGAANKYGLALERAMSVREGGEKQKIGNAAAVVEKEKAMKQRLCQDKSWEEEVRRALAKSCKVEEGGNGVAHTQNYAGGPFGLQRSTSVREYGSSCGTVLPPTFILKRASGGKLAKGGAAVFEEAGAKLMQDVGSCRQSKASPEKRRWEGLTVKSPSEKRWEEAAEYEERQEMMRRRARSQSMRYDGRVPELPINAAEENSYYDDDEEWAVYRRSGYISVRPRRSHDQPCRNSTSCIGRSMSMRDPAMGVVMECAACGAAIEGAGGRVLCSCSCCAASRAPVQQAPVVKKKGGGVLRACRRLLGLAKKRPSSAQP